MVNGKAQHLAGIILIVEMEAVTLFITKTTTKVFKAWSRKLLL